MYILLNINALFQLAFIRGVATPAVAEPSPQVLQIGSASVEPDIVVTNVITTTVTIFAGRDKPFIIGHKLAF